MRGIFKLNLLIVIIEPLATAQHYFPNITEILKSMYQYQQQRTIKIYENYGYHHIDYCEDLLYCQKHICKHGPIYF